MLLRSVAAFVVVGGAWCICCVIIATLVRCVVLLCACFQPLFGKVAHEPGELRGAGLGNKWRGGGRIPVETGEDNDYEKNMRKARACST